VLKSGFFDQFNTWSIQGINVHFNLFVKGYNQTRNTDFRILQHPNTDWQATKVNENKMFLRMAALYHYNIDVALLQRYCGWRHTGNHRRWQEILFWLKFILNEEEYAELAHGFEHGIPQEIHSNKKNTYSNLQQYIHNGNLKNIHDNLALVSKTIAKEDAREFSMIVPSFLVYFIPHLWIIPVGIVNKEHKKPRIYRHGTKQYSEDSFPANRLIDMSTKPAITFGDTMLTLLTHLWNTRATFPKDRIILYGDNLASCFCQRQLAPAFAAANTRMYKQYLIISTGNHFGGRWGPANNEPRARA
jgi:hypothetical protein